MIKCKICGNEFRSLGIHLRHKHNISVEEYLSRYPGSEIISEESRLKYSTASKRNWENPEIRESQLIRLKSYSNSEDNKERLRKQNKDPKFIDSQRERLSKLMTETNKKQWSSNYEQSFVRANKNWVKSPKFTNSSVQKEVQEYLSLLGISVIPEKPIKIDDQCIVLVDIYLPEYDAVIEVNGSHWHGNIEFQTLEEMSDIQRSAYYKDLVKKDFFKDRMLTIWDYQVNNDEYKSKIKEYLSTIGHVK